MIDPNKEQVDKTIRDLALRSLIGAPVGTIAMESAGIGYKKMGFWWMLRVLGLRKAISSKWADWRGAPLEETK